MKIDFFDISGKAIYSTIPEQTKYPDGQPHIKIDIPDRSLFCNVVIKGSIRNPDELFNWLMAKQILDAESYNPSLEIYWLFGARMDRSIDKSTPNTFTVVVMALSLFGDSYDQISILDLHNQSVVQDLGKLDINPFIEETVKDFGDCDIFFPDKGAQKRYSKLFKNTKKSILTGSKERDSQTGRLSNFQIESGKKTKDSVLIVDDICAGGYTFFGHSESLRKLGYTKVGLYTTHGVYSGDMSILKDFDGIYSSNSFQWDDQLLTLNKYKVTGKEMERISATPVNIS